MNYYFNKTVPDAFDTVIENVTKLLKDEGFGVITNINMQETFQEKLKLDIVELQWNMDTERLNIEPLMDVIKNPVKIWDLADYELRQMLIFILFGGEILLTKNEGL